MTEGSTPKGTYDRGCLLTNTRRLDRFHMIQRTGRAVPAPPGATVFSRWKKTAETLGGSRIRVIGSSCIGASVVGVLCNNSRRFAVLSGGRPIQNFPSMLGSPKAGAT